jgi:hypothetical protein
LNFFRKIGGGGGSADRLTPLCARIAAHFDRFFFLIMQDLLRAVQFIFVIFTVFLRTLTKRPRRQDDDNKQRKRQKQREQKTSQTVGSGDVIVVYDFV